MKDTETIADILDEMRGNTAMTAKDAFYDLSAWKELIERIESACDRERRSAFGILRQCNRDLSEENDALRAKVGRLEREEKPKTISDATVASGENKENR